VREVSACSVAREEIGEDVASAAGELRRSPCAVDGLVGTYEEPAVAIWLKAPKGQNKEEVVTCPVAGGKSLGFASGFACAPGAVCGGWREASACSDAREKMSDPASGEDTSIPGAVGGDLRGFSACSLAREKALGFASGGPAGRMPCRTAG